MENLDNKLFIYFGKRGGLNDLTLRINKISKDSLFILSSSNDQLDAYINKYVIDTFNNFIGFFISLFKLPFIIKKLKRKIKVIYSGKEIYFTGFHPWDFFAIQSLKRKYKIYYFIHDPETHKGEQNRIINYLQKKIITDRAVDIVTLSEYSFNILKLKKDIRQLHYWPIDGFFDVVEGKRLNTSEVINIVFFGRIIEYKGFEKIPEIKLIIDSETKYRFKVFVWGQGDFKIIKHLQDSLVNCDLRFEWIATDEIENLLQKNTIVVLPYDEATQSGIVPLSKSFGAGIVVTPVGGLVEQIRDYNKSCIAEDVSAKQIANAILKYIKK